jgi:hypothetical protein
VRGGERSSGVFWFEIKMREEDRTQVAGRRIDSAGYMHVKGLER